MVIIGNCWYTVVTVLRKSSVTVTIKGLRERTGHNAFNLCTYALSNPPSIFIPEGKNFQNFTERRSWLNISNSARYIWIELHRDTFTSGSWSTLLTHRDLAKEKPAAIGKASITGNVASVRRIWSPLHHLEGATAEIKNQRHWGTEGKHSRRKISIKFA